MLRHMLDALQLALASTSKAADWVDRCHASTASQPMDSPSAALSDIKALSSPSKGAALSHATNVDSTAADAEPMDEDGGGVQASERGAPEDDIIQQPGQGQREQAHEQVQRSAVGDNAWRGFK